VGVHENAAQDPEHFFTKDTIYTRPERIMVIGIFFLFTMALNCLLFIFRGNANAGASDWEIFVSQTTYIVVASVCQTPIMFFIVLMFHRTAPPRPVLEGRWIGAPLSEVLKKVRRCVLAREQELRADRAVHRAKLAIGKDKAMVRTVLEERLKLAVWLRGGAR
jgi:hypothetical protein